MAELSYPAAGAAAAGSRLDLRGAAAPFALGALGVLGLGAANGGYFPSSWGWAAVALAAVLVWALATGAPFRPTGLEAAFLGGLALSTGWVALSSVWGVSSQALDEAGRVVVYLAGVAAARALAHRGRAAALLAGVLAGATAVAGYALATRLFPERIGSFDSVAGYRLASPIGYWNGLGLLCALALLLGLAVVASTGSPLRAALAAAPAPVLASTLSFTFSRGAWLSLGIGLALALALDPRRLRLTATALALGLPAVAGVYAGSRSDALTHQRATIARAAHDGHRLALLLAVLVVAAAALAAGSSLLRRRMVVPATASRVYAAVLLAAALAALAAALVRLGGPAAAAHRAWHTFRAPPPKTGTDLRERLFSFSGTGRAELYRAAWADARAHPLVGSGAGSFEAYWLRHRPDGQTVRDAHSLYLETLAEQGAVGLALLTVALAAPLVAAVRVRRRPGVAAAAGAYAAYLAGAAVDWDWELAAVTLAALLTGAALLSAARPDEEREPPPRLRYGALAGALAIAAAGFVFLVGHMLLARASDAARDGRWASAVRDARRAASWLPWSIAPWRQLGEAQLALGDTAAARASFRTALRKDPGDWSLWFDLARASSGPARTAALARAKRLDPRSPEIAELERELAAEGAIAVDGGKP